MKNGKSLSIAYWVVVLAMLALGAVGMYWRLTAGHTLANYGELITSRNTSPRYFFIVFFVRTLLKKGSDTS